ncbi:MAG: phosphonate ABC transporter ATP-binding protein, partial [Bacteroidota bacterium]
DPEVILADEPTGNLDTETAQEIVGLLYEISKAGRAVVIATHDFHLFEYFTGRTIRCENGRIADTECKMA